jgi:predicted GIY-YIG superfamily endonuclease
MNKRIQKKVAKRDAELLAQAQTDSAQPGRPRATVRSVAEQALQLAREAGPLGVVRLVASEVQDRTTEAIGQAKEQVKEKVAEAKQKIVAQEERAEAALEKVPVVGGAAAKKLHELTHR